MHYENHLGQLYKKSSIDTFLFSCFLIWSDYTTFHLEVENFGEMLKKNSYPSRIIEQSIKSFLNKLYVPKNVIPTVPKKEIFIILPYLGTMSFNLNQKLRTCFKNSLPQCNIKITWLLSWQILFLLFWVLKMIFLKCYSLTQYINFCAVTANVTYYGKTECHLNIRSGEHLGLSYLKEKGKTANHLQFQVTFPA